MAAGREVRQIRVPAADWAEQAHDDMKDIRVLQSRARIRTLSRNHAAAGSWIPVMRSLEPLPTGGRYRLFHSLSASAPASMRQMFRARKSERDGRPQLIRG